MNGVESFLSFIIGLFVRIGLPVGITLVMFWLLNRLDARWQNEAADAQAKVAVKTVCCWEKRGCDPEKRAACPAYLNQELPCWQVFRSKGGPMKEACLSCKVFQEAPVPVYR